MQRQSIGIYEEGCRDCSIQGSRILGLQGVKLRGRRQFDVPSRLSALRLEAAVNETSEMRPTGSYGGAVAEEA
jgi:hypothetical protein